LLVLAGVAAASTAVAARSSTSAEATRWQASALARPLGAVGGSKLEGRWKTKRATLQQLIAAGIKRKEAEALQRRVRGTPAIEFHEGVFKGLDLDTGHVVSNGTYRIAGNVVSFVFKTGVAVRLGAIYALRWNVYRDRLTFSNVPGRKSLGALTINPWTRVR
jgi:hypothetical protein